MTLVIIVGISLFMALVTLFLFLLPRASAESALLEQVVRDSRQEQQVLLSGWRSALNAEYLARPFTVVRKLFSPEPNADLVRRLSLAGYRKPSHADIFLGVRLALPAVLGFVSAYLFESNVIIFFIMAVLIGFFAPDLWLSRAITKRREEIKLSLPDALDLLAICLEAGLGLDQAIVRVGQELRVSHRALSEELLLINFEQRAGVQRIAAWQGFSERADVESVRSFVAMLVQTDRFGTPVAKSLGAFSDALRIQRRQLAEEQAAKTTIKLVPPLVFFIFPAMGVVTVGPALITVGNNLSHIVK